MLLRLVAVLVLSAFASAQPPDVGPPSTEQIMRSPVGKQLQWVLKCINERAAPDAPGNFTERFLEQFKIEDVQKRLSTLRDEAFKGEEVSLVRHEAEPRPDAMSAIIGNEDAERYLSVILSVNEESGKIAGMLFAVAGGPGGEGEARWDNLDGDLGRVQGGLWFGAYEVLVQRPGTKQADASVDPVYEFGWRKWLNLSHVSRAWVIGANAALLADGKVHLDDKVKFRTGEEPSLRETLAKSAASDAEATDALIKFVGRADVEAYLRECSEKPHLSIPFLTQRENTLLKAPPNDALLKDYAAGDEDDRLDILSEKGRLAAALEDTAGIAAWQQPREIQRVGWFASNREAGYALARLHALAGQPGMEEFAGAWRAPNPRITVDGVEQEAVVFDPKVWPKTAFLGGSEPGAMSLAWLLTRDDGKVYAMVMAWNNVDGPLEENKFYELAKKGLAILEKEGRPAAEKAPAEGAAK